MRLLAGVDAERSGDGNCTQSVRTGKGSDTEPTARVAAAAVAAVTMQNTIFGKNGIGAYITEQRNSMPTTHFPVKKNANLEQLIACALDAK